MSTLPDNWHPIFIQFRKNGDACGADEAKSWRASLSDEDWQLIEQAAQVWQGVKQRSAVARSSLMLFEALSKAEV